LTPVRSTRQAAQEEPETQGHRSTQQGSRKARLTLNRDISNKLENKPRW